MSPGPLFESRWSRSRGPASYGAGGELDRSTADRLSYGARCGTGRRRTAFLDLSAVSFIDSAGLQFLVCAGEARRARPGLVHRPASRAVWRLIELTGTRSELPLMAPPCAKASRHQGLPLHCSPGDQNAV